MAEAAADKKAENIVILDVRGLASYTDFIMIASGHSDRQVCAIGESVETHVARAKGPRLVGREGYDEGRWVLVDFGEVVMHVFTDTERQFFDLENLWADAPRVVYNPQDPKFFAEDKKPVETPAAPRTRRRRAN